MSYLKSKCIIGGFVFYKAFGGSESWFREAIEIPWESGLGHGVFGGEGILWSIQREIMGSKIMYIYYVKRRFWLPLLPFLRMPGNRRMTDKQPLSSEI